MLGGTNPILGRAMNNPYRFEDGGAASDRPASDRAVPAMTVSGTAWKTLYLLFLTVLSAAVSWGWLFDNMSQGLMLWVSLGAIAVSLLAGFVVLAAPKLAPFTVPLFAVGEGTFLAAMTMLAIGYVPGALLADGSLAPEGIAVVGQAVGATFAIALACFAGYATGVIRIGGGMSKVLGVAVAGVGIYYVGAFLLNFIPGVAIPRLGWELSPASGTMFWVGLGFSGFVVVLASLLLIRDFQMIEEQAASGAPKVMEWLGAFGVLTTLAWLYIEVLRLIIKLRALLGRE